MATLKISDLSVGDWIGFEMANLSIEGDDIATAFVGKINKPARIKSISGDQDLILAEVDNVDNFGAIYLKLENISPVPITAEILEENGFVRGKRGNYYHYLLLDKNRTLYIHASTNGWRVEITYDAAGMLRTTHLMPNMNSVHQLQHAIRLAGVDKEINL